MIYRIFTVFVAAPIISSALISCAGQPSLIPTTAETILLAEPFSAEHYAVSPTDILQIDVYREDDITGKYVVDPSGTINMPLIGRIPVSGLNMKTVEHTLKQRFGNGFIVDPDIRVSVIQFRPVFVTGEVKEPNRLPFTPGMTVQQAIVLAGGPTRFAAKKYYLQRGGSSNTKRVDGSSMLFPGDVLTVGERLF